jgi:LysR family transcriptional regulator for bpeEF and oprC
MDRLRTIEVFTRVAELGSFSRAAEALRLPKASVTAAVQELEARLQVRLLNRTTRRVALTADGAAYYEESARLVRELSELESGMVRATRAPQGRVRVDVPAAAGRHVIAPALPEFLARFPDVTVELGSTDRPVDLTSEGVDCVIRGGDMHDESLVARRVGALPVVTCAAPAYLDARGVPADLDALDAHVFVNFFSARTGRLFEVDFTRDGVTRSFVPRSAAAANDADTWVALAVAGLGLIQLPCSRNVREHLVRGQLRRVLPAWSAGSLPLSVLYPRNRHLAARVRVFVDWVADLYGRECAEAEAFVSGADAAL